MSVLRARLLPQRLFLNAWRTFADETGRETPPKPPYWHTKFPDLVPRSFEEMPTVNEATLNPYKLHEVYPQWYEKYGFVVKQPVGNGRYTVHCFHFEDFNRVYRADGESGKTAERYSHLVIKEYRENNTHMYNSVGLGPGTDNDHVRGIRKLIFQILHTVQRKNMEKIAEDLVEIIRVQVGKEGEIELLPLLHRWGFENVGFAFLNKRLGALSLNASEEGEKMVEAAAITNEMIVLTTLDPLTDYAERYRKVETAQNYFYSVLKKHIEDLLSQPESECPVRGILGKSPKDAITATLDGFQGAVQTVPLTVLIALYNVARNKDIQTRAREEIMKCYPFKDSRWPDEPIPPRTFLWKIMGETWRFNPPIIGNGRIIPKNVVLGGYNVPEKTNVILHFQVACRLHEFFHEPHLFNPDRTVREHPALQYLFGGSSRTCVGQAFAKYSVFFMLAKLLRNFEFSFDGEEITWINKLHNEPEKPLFLRLKPVPN